jgi:glutaredoxin
MRASTRLAIAFAMLAAPALADAQSSVYRWVDKNGKVQYSDTPPPEDVKNLTQKRMGGGAVEVSQLPYATQIAMQKSPVTMYTAPACGELCTSGRDLLVKRGIPYSERDVSNVTDAEAVKKLTGDVRVPLLVVGDNKVRGYEEGAWNGALDGAGYPRTALPGQLNPRAAAAPKKDDTPPAPPPEPVPPPQRYYSK